MLYNADMSQNRKTAITVVAAFVLSIFLAVEIGVITGRTQRSTGPPYQEFNHGVVALSDAQAAAIYPGEDARQVYDVQMPDLVQFPADGSPNPHGIETWFWNLPGHHRLALIIGDNHVRAINAFDENGDNIRHEIDKRWYQSVSSDQ